MYRDQAGQKADGSEDMDKTDKKQEKKEGKGKVAAEYRITEGSLDSMSVVFPDGECRIVISLGESWDEITGYLVLDEDLNLLKTIDVSGASFVRLVTREWEDDSIGCILLGRGDRTDICDLSGETVATLPFAYDSQPDVMDGSMFFADDTGTM